MTRGNHCNGVKNDEVGRWQKRRNNRKTKTTKARGRRKNKEIEKEAREESKHREDEKKAKRKRCYIRTPREEANTHKLKEKAP